MEIHQKISMPNYQKLKTMVKRSINQKLRLRNFDARHGRIESGAVVKSRKGQVGVEGGKGTLLPVERKWPVFERRPMQFPHESNDRAQKPEHTAATPSEPSFSRGRSVSRKRSIRGKSNHGATILRQPCRYYLKGTCTRTSFVNIGTRLSANSIKVKRVAKSGDKCLFPHHKVDEQPNTRSQRKAAIHLKEEKATTRTLWLS